MTTTSVEMNKGGSCCAPSCCGGDAVKPSTSASAEPVQAIRETVKERYGAAAKAALQGGKSSCCGSGDAGLDWTDPITRDLYDAEQAAGVPAEALLASFGCGNPTALAQLKPGETVLDLGSGGGIDVLLSAKRVGPTGKAYGLDMTDEMLDLAQKNKAASGATNVEFLKGHIESIPLPRASVDVIISNCVINLSGDKDAVLNEAFRVLKPGGRLAVSDIVLTRDLPAAAKTSMALWTGCVAGALLENEYVSKLRAAGFTHIEVEPTRVYSTDEMTEMASSAGLAGAEPIIAQMGGAIMSAFVRATKPV